MRIEEGFRNRSFALIAKAYTSINLSLAQTYLGLAQEPLLACASFAL
jgi:COP9 signalosome complex subunit 8